MKTYEEMARDVLRRRDEEFLKIQQTSHHNAPPEVVYPAVTKKRSLLPKIAIPCAAAVLVGAVGVSVWKNVHKNNTRWEYFNQGVAELDDLTPGMAQDYRDFADVYKGGENYICINKVKRWNTDNQPELLEEDFRAIDDDKINRYYGMEFDRLSRLFPEWESEHEPFGTYEHDEEDEIVASHAILSSTNSITYKPDTGGTVTISASYQRFSSASLEDAQPSVINGFDAMIYNLPINKEYAADLAIGNAYVTIRSSYVDELEFVKILDFYTAPVDRTETFLDNIIIMDEMPEFVDQIMVDPKDHEGAEKVPYSMDELSQFYGIDFARFETLHPDWQKLYDESNLFIYEDEWTKNTLFYQTPDYQYILVEAMTGLMPASGIELSNVNGYTAMIYKGWAEVPEDGDDYYQALIEINGTLVRIGTAGYSESEFVDLVREYTKNIQNMMTKPIDKQNAEDKIVVLDKVPEEFLNNDPFITQKEVDFEHCVHYTMDEMSEFYGIDLGRLGKLHKDWTEEIWNIYGELTLYQSSSGNGYDSTHNTLLYSNHGFNRINVYVDAMIGDMPTIDVEHSTINGYDAIVYNGWTDSPDSKSALQAVIDMNGTLVRISTLGYPEEELTRLLYEFTAETDDPYYDMNNPIKLVDPFERQISYTVDFSLEDHWWRYDSTGELNGYNTTEEYHNKTEQWLTEFFGTNPFPKELGGNYFIDRDPRYGDFRACNMPLGTKAYSPVEGKVIATCENFNYGLGMSIAVEFDSNKIFIIGNLDSIDVKVGDTIAPGQAIGVYESTGTILTMVKAD